MEIQLWKDILNPYELAVEELLVKFNHLIKEYQDRVCTADGAGLRQSQIDLQYFR